MPAASSEPYPVVIDCSDSHSYEIPLDYYGTPRVDVSICQWGTGKESISYLQVKPNDNQHASISFISPKLSRQFYYNIYVVTVPAHENNLPSWLRTYTLGWDENNGSFTETYQFFTNPNPVTANSDVANADVILSMSISDQCFVASTEKLDTLLIQSGYQPTYDIINFFVSSYGLVSQKYREVIYTRTLSLHKIIMVPYATAEDAKAHVGEIPEIGDLPQPTNGLYYDFHGDGTCQVVNGSIKATGDIVVPETVEHEGQNYKVTSLGSYAFFNSSITSLIIPTSVQQMGSYAVANCSQLKSLSIMGENIRLESKALAGSENIENMTLNMSEISNTFTNFTQLKSLRLGDDVRVIGNNAFRNCTALESITFNEKLDSILNYAFTDCGKLDSIAFGPSLRYIGSEAFKYCYSLKAVSIEATVPPELGFNYSPFFLGKSPILYVPEGRSIYYRVAKGWRDFSKIIAPDDSGEEKSIPYPTITMNKVWDTHYTFNDGTKKNKRYIVGDLCIINDKIWGMVFARERYLSALNSILKESFDYSQTDTLYYYQEDDKVYCLAEDGSTEMLMFDYGLKVGDVFVNSNGEQFHVVETDFFEEYENHFMQLADSVPPRTLRLRSDDGTQEQVWIEGFGETQCGIVPLYMVEKLKKIDSRPTHSITPNNYFNGGYSGLNDGMFDVNEDDYKLIHFVPVEAKEKRDLEYTFVGDTLCVNGNYLLHNYNSATCFECIITKDNTIALSIWTYNYIPITGLFTVDVDVKIPGFKPGTYNVNGKMRVCEGNNPDGDYHPFIEEGKVWKLGWLTWEDIPAHELKYYFFGGDTIVNEVKGTRLMCQEMSKEEKNTYYVGSVREDDRVVYFTPADQSQEYVLYDFSAEVGDTLDIYCKEVGSTLSCIIDEKNTKTTYNGRQNRYVDIRVKLDDLPDEVDDYNFIDRWYEGIGRNGELENGPSVYPTGMYGYSIINCTVGNDTIWNSASTEDVTQYWSDEDGEVKKQKIDFTHVIKTKPTSPQPVSTNISLLWGEYSNAVLNIDFEGMNGRYKINVRKDGEQQDRFSANQETHNLQSLDVNLAGYPDGDYTVVVENDGESFTAHFAPPLDGTRIESIQNSKFKIHNGADAIYDLSGRRVINPKRGMYIQGNKKIAKQ
jgi:hypothetical protein